MKQVWQQEQLRSGQQEGNGSSLRTHSGERLSMLCCGRITQVLGPNAMLVTARVIGCGMLLPGQPANIPQCRANSLTPDMPLAVPALAAPLLPGPPAPALLPSSAQSCVLATTQAAAAARPQLPQPAACCIRLADANAARPEAVRSSRSSCSNNMPCSA